MATWCPAAGRATGNRNVIYPASLSAIARCAPPRLAALRTVYPRLSVSRSAVAAYFLSPGRKTGLGIQTLGVSWRSSCDRDGAGRPLIQGRRRAAAAPKSAIKLKTAERPEPHCRRAAVQIPAEAIFFRAKFPACTLARHGLARTPGGVLAWFASFPAREGSRLPHRAPRVAETRCGGGGPRWPRTAPHPEASPEAAV